ncbi:antigen 5 like allergen Cul n 1 [Bactrocera neohumeralis]|uniref:antigen 5 like allergen Cul n 1 n=1 Tax=Bactrocera neohumeralis TaxID=98809 RepID=UPI0021653654|nr:antigen 5 like allergen Cul n 1 [Bactrocera neohumeralis]
MFHKLLLRACLTLLIAELSLVQIAKTDTALATTEEAAATTRAIPIPATTIAGVELHSGLTTESPTNPNTATSQSSVDSNATSASSTYTTNNNTPNAPTNTATASDDISSNAYCTPSLCELYNGSHVLQVPHIGCNNDGAFAPACGAEPHLLYMSQRRRQFILDMHNLARERIASGQLEGYRAAAHMPMLKWDDELEYMASLHVKRCQFAHDQCRNTPRYQFSGQNIGYFWIGREFKSHAKRFKSFILDWFREYRLANQSFIDQYRPHPEGKKIGHFTMLVADRAHRVGCAAIRYRDPSDINYMKLLMTCNYDYTNILGEPVYQSGLAASKCIYKISEKYPSLCDWKDAVYDYSSEESVEEDNGNELDSNFIN